MSRPLFSSLQSPERASYIPMRRRDPRSDIDGNVRV